MNNRQNRLDQVFDNILDDICNMSNNMKTSGEVQSNEYTAEKLENGDNQISINMAGYNPKDVSIQLKDDILTVNKTVLTGISSTRSKYPSIQFKLYDKLDGKKTTAKFNYGMLIITIPLKKERKPIDIEINID
jgi:HSP20 family molecular chaperone IbpA